MPLLYIQGIPFQRNHFLDSVFLPQEKTGIFFVFKSRQYKVRTMQLAEISINFENPYEIGLLRLIVHFMTLPIVYS